MRSDGGRATRGTTLRSLARLGVLAVTAVLVVSTTGLASSLASSSKTLGNGSAPVTSCDTDGVKVVLNLNATPAVSGATVSGVAATCVGATLSLDVNNGLTNSAGTAVVPSGGGTMTITLTTPLAPKDSMQSDLTLAGP
jgi:hypothetical protein